MENLLDLIQLDNLGFFMSGIVTGFILNYFINGRTGFKPPKLKLVFSLAILILFSVSIGLEWFDPNFKANMILYIVFPIAQGAIFEVQFSDAAKIIIEILKKNDSKSRN